MNSAVTQSFVLYFSPGSYHDMMMINIKIVFIQEFLVNEILLTCNGDDKSGPTISLTTIVRYQPDSRMPDRLRSA